MNMMLVQPRRLVRFWWFVRDGLPSVGRYRRYLLALTPPIAAIWVLTAAYLLFVSPRYDSDMTLILPGAGSGGSLNLESIGQASASTASPFSSPSLSPTENYKRLLGSDVVLRAAATEAGEDGDVLPAPKVKLIDQTNLIEVKISGGTPEQAHLRMQALRSSFLSALENLRADEAEKREAADSVRIRELQAKVDDAQRALLQFQGASGLVSLDQFSARIAGLDQLQSKERQRRADLSEADAAAGRLARTLGVSIGDARQALLLRADPVFQQLLSRYAVTVADRTQTGSVLGEAAGPMQKLTAERAELARELSARGASLTGLRGDAVMRFADLAVSDGRARLIEQLLAGDSSRAGTKGALSEIRRQIAEQAGQKDDLVAQAAELADLTRDLRVAEAVFSSALARLDTNKSDPFASYPLVQTLEQPSLPGGKASPSPVLAIGGALAATFFTFVGFLLLWLRQPIIRKLLPNA